MSAPLRKGDWLVLDADPKEARALVAAGYEIDGKWAKHKFVLHLEKTP